MTVRLANASDLGNIVALLKASLGESLMPKSEQYWQWKHIDNPFGASPVLLAEENGQLVGVRAFMRWRWSNGNSILTAVRAVDTATHPAFQGKGIFSKLTKALLEDCRQQGVSIVFNTPNSKSLPGYLKMGWVQAGKLPLKVKAGFPFTFANSANNTDLAYFLNHQSLGKLVATGTKPAGNFITDYSVPYLKWRYQTVPVAEYSAVGIEHGNELEALAIYRIKTGKIKELRVTDVFVANNMDVTELNRELSAAAKNHKANIITFANTGQTAPSGLAFNANSLGPIVTVRDVISDSIGPFLNFKNWSPSLGDMELF